MKVLMGLLVFVSCNLFAQSRVIVNPQIPIDCVKDNARYVNWISNIKVLEDHENVEVTFLTKYGSCYSGAAIYDSLNSLRVAIFTGGIKLPWQKEGFRVTEKRKDDKTFEVSLVFNKNKIFNKKNHVSYVMVLKHYLLEFNWDLSLVYNEDTDATLVKIK